MLLRRITEYITAQNWFAVAVDFFIVVIGVYIGVQASNWNDARKENQRGEYFAVRLLDEVREELEVYDSELRYFLTVFDYAKRAVELLEQDNRVNDNALVVSAYNATQYSHAESSMPTFEELISTGNLYLVRDENLKAAANGIYRSEPRTRLYQNVRDSAFRERVRRIIPHDVQEAIREQCGDKIDPVTKFISGLPANCRIDFDQERIAAAAELLRNDTELRSDLALLLSSFGVHISDVEAVRRLTEQLLVNSSADSGGH